MRWQWAAEACRSHAVWQRSLTASWLVASLLQSWHAVPAVVHALLCLLWYMLCCAVLSGRPAG